MADLSTLFGASPEVASYFMGQNQGNQVQMDQMKQQELAQLIQQRMQEANQASQMNPLLLEKQRLANSTTSAELPGVAARAGQEVTKNDIATATKDSDIEAKKSANTASISKDQYDEYTNKQKILLAAGAGLDQIPVPLRASALQQQLTSAGVKTDGPTIQAILRGDPNQMPQQIQALAQRLGDQLLAQNPQARATMYSADKHAAAELGAANIHAGASVRVAEINKEAKLETAKGKSKDLVTQVMSGALSPDRAFTAATFMYQNAESADEREVYRKLAATLEGFVMNKASAGGIGKPTLDNGQITPRTVAPVTPQAPGGPVVGQTKSGVKFKIVGQ